jgi:hypothetical protein
VDCTTTPHSSLRVGFTSLLIRQQLAAVGRSILVWAILVPQLVLAQAAPAEPPPVSVAKYRTSSVATLISLRSAPSSSGIAASLGEDIIGDVTFCLLKLRIHSVKALSVEGTPVRKDEVVEALSREPVEKKFIGKQVKVEMELRGDTQRHRWLVTKIDRALSSPGPVKKE